MKNRGKKKRDKQQWLERRRLEKKQRLELVLTALGLLDGFRIVSDRFGLPPFVEASPLDRT